MTLDIYENRSKSFKPHLERRVIAEHYCCGSIPQLLIKLKNLIQISGGGRISIQMRPMQKCLTNLKSG